eukprot:Gb_39691 [translate_table: standard]
MALVLGIRRLLGSTTTGRLLLTKEPCYASRSLPVNCISLRGVSTKLFVSGLSKRTTDEGLREAFSRFGQVLEAKVITDKVSGVSKGFAFVRYASLEEAEKGREGMDGKFLDGWVIFADYAKPRPPRTLDGSPGFNTTTVGGVEKI